MRFKKRPVVIDAFQWDGTPEGVDTIVANFSDIVGLYSGGVFGIMTMEGPIQASPGDWIIRDAKGEYYPCKPDIFEMTYEEAVDE